LSCKKRGFKNGNKRRKCEGLKQSRTVEEKKDRKNQRPRAKFIKVLRKEQVVFYLLFPVL